jgi:mono/diheme cytochrome c family protein
VKAPKTSIALAAVAAVLLFFAALVAWLNRDDPAPHDGDRRPLAADNVAAAGAGSADLVARGEYLVRAGSCLGCHTEPGGEPYAGGRAIETPFGIVNSPNLTADATGLAGLEQRRLLAGDAQRAIARRAACSIRPSRIRTTRVSRAPTATRCSPT